MVEIPPSLKIEPEAAANVEEMAEPDGRTGSDSAPTIDDLVNPLVGERRSRPPDRAGSAPSARGGYQAVLEGPVAPRQSPKLQACVWQPATTPADGTGELRVSRGR